MAVYMCLVCETVYDEEKERKKWYELPDGWVCQVCESGKSFYRLIQKAFPPSDREKKEAPGYPDEFLRAYDDVEIHMADIHKIAEIGESIIEPMRTKTPAFSWDEILIMGAQLAKIPLNHDEPVNMKTTIGPDAREPMAIESPIYITHMSFGALSREAKIALAKGSAGVKTAMCSGEGGILPESLENAYSYIFEYVPNEYSVTEENLKGVDAIEIKFFKPPAQGGLPADKFHDCEIIEGEELCVNRSVNSGGEGIGGYRLVNLSRRGYISETDVQVFGMPDPFLFNHGLMDFLKDLGAKISKGVV